VEILVKQNKRKLLFRASSCGALMTDGRGKVVTPNQYAEYERLFKMRDDFNNAVAKSKALTPNQEKTLNELIAKVNAPFELSDTAKAMIREMWLYREKGIKSMAKSKYLEKGQYNEEAAISLLCDVDGVYYRKNTERKNNGVLTGEADILHKIRRRKIVYDTKCSWDANTFMAAGEDKYYEWQGRVYMELYGCDEFHIKYVLLDCPPHIFESERRKLAYAHGIIDDTLEEHQELFNQLHTNLIYSTNPAFTKEERVKTIVYHRDDTKIEELYDRIPYALKYYDTITLNGKAA